MFINRRLSKHPMRQQQRSFTERVIVGALLETIFLHVQDCRMPNASDEGQALLSFAHLSLHPLCPALKFKQIVRMQTHDA